MLEWAKRAGSLVFQEVEEFYEDNIVTFCNLAMFWHSQGSWRISQLHKGTSIIMLQRLQDLTYLIMTIGNACQLAYILGLGSEANHADNSLKFEIRRRRFWACYLMHCHGSERFSLFESETDKLALKLPWPEEDFSAGNSKCPQVSLGSVQSNGGIFSELIKALTLW